MMSNEMRMEGNIAEFAKEMKKLINNKEHRFETWSLILVVEEEI